MGFLNASDNLVAFREKANRFKYGNQRLDDMEQRRAWQLEDEARALEGAQTAVTALRGEDPAMIDGPPLPGYAEQSHGRQNRSLAEMMVAGGPTSDMAQQQMQGEQPGQAGIGTPSPKDFTTESLKSYQQSGDPTSLVRWNDPLSQRRVNMAEDRLMLQQMMATRPSDGQMNTIIDGMNQLALLDQVNGLMAPEYFGHGLKVVGEAKDWIMSRKGGEAAENYSNFWNNYRWWVAEIRKSQIGTQMTDTELRDFERRIVKPEDSYTVASTKLQQQRQMVRQQLMTRKGALEDLGYTTPTLPFNTPGTADGPVSLDEF